MRKGVLLTALAVAVVVVGTAVAAFPQDNVKLYTGCLTSGGTIVSVKEGDSPTQTCAAPSKVVKLSGGDITSVTAGTGLSGGGTNGAVTLNLDAAHSLPSGCTSGQVAKSSGSDTWSCAADNDHTYSNGTGLDLSGNTFSIASDYRVTNNQSCDSGEFATGLDGSGNLTCGSPPATSQQTFTNIQTSSMGILSDGLRHEVIARNVPAGDYSISAAGGWFSENDEDPILECDIYAGSTLVTSGEAFTPHGDGGTRGTMSLLYFYSTPTATTLHLYCNTIVSGVSVNNWGLQAIKL